MRVNVEADSLNAAVLGPDVEPAADMYELFLADVVRDMTQKAGQKCTAIRRVLVPAAIARRRCATIWSSGCGAVRVGDPAREDVRMGPLATAAQLADVREGVGAARAARASSRSAAPRRSRLRASNGQGLLRLAGAGRGRRGRSGSGRARARGVRPGGDAGALRRRAADAAAIVARGDGGLVSSRLLRRHRLRSRRRCSASRRITAGSSSAIAKIAEHSPGPGTVLPQLVHGGPGRAGGGEELGGLRGLAFYMQRVALEGSRPVIGKLLGPRPE